MLHEFSNVQVLENWFCDGGVRLVYLCGFMGQTSALSPLVGFLRCVVKLVVVYESVIWKVNLKLLFVIWVGYSRV